jgi:Actinobacteria/chloroflexi VLRF1 release factor
VVTRVVEVSADRLVGWVERYSATHPGTTHSLADGFVRLAAEGGASADLVPLIPLPSGVEVGTSDLVSVLAAHAERPTVVGLVLIRRGGYAVGVAREGRLLASKVGTRYVQSRTAAGGWSQQRFARRRDGQARDLLDAAGAAWRGLDHAALQRIQVLVTGGDKGMCDRLLADPRLSSSPVARHIDVPDPRQRVLEEAALRVRALVVTVREA